MRINVAIAMTDRVLYMHGVWDTLEDEIPMLRRDDLLYSLIAMFKKRMDKFLLFPILALTWHLLLQIVRDCLVCSSISRMIVRMF